MDKNKSHMPPNPLEALGPEGRLELKRERLHTHKVRLYWMIFLLTIFVIVDVLVNIM